MTLHQDIKYEFIKSVRKQRRRLTPIQRVVVNAGLIAGISFVSTLSTNFPPTAQNLWGSSLAALLALLLQLTTINELCLEQPKRPFGMLI